MKLLGTLFVTSCLFFYSDADKVDDAIRYFDEVLTVHFPRFLENERLNVYELPNFSYNYQNRSQDGRATTAKIYYHTGNLTGIKSVNRKSCKEPTWTFSNITAECTVVFPNITIKYQARLQMLSPISDGVRLRHMDFNVAGDIAGMEAAIEITASPHLKIPALKNLKITNNGRPSFRFGHVGNLSYETVSSHFYHKFNEIFQEVFYDSYRQAFVRAVESIPYPF